MRGHFKSLKDIYNEIVAEEAFYHKHQSSITEQLKNNLISKGYMGKTATENAEMFIFSKEEGVSFNLPYPSIAVFLSPKGLVRIGDKIYQFKGKSIKIITDGDPKKIPLLNNIENTDVSLGIQVNAIKFLPINQQKPADLSIQSLPNIAPDYVQPGSTFVRSCDDCIGSPCEFRVIGYENFTAPTNGSNTYVHTTTLRNLIRGFLGYWYDNNQNNETGNINGHLNFRAGVFGPVLSNSMPNYNVTGYGSTVSASYTFTFNETNLIIDSAFWYTCPSIACRLN